MANLVYTLFVGIPACVMLMTVGSILCLTVIGIPLGLTLLALGFKLVTLPPFARLIASSIGSAEPPRGSRRP